MIFWKFFPVGKFGSPEGSFGCLYGFLEVFKENLEVLR